MKLQDIHTPIILLLDQKRFDNAFVKTWFEKSRFKAVEAANVFQLLEEVSDFTVRKCPDVIILEAGSLLHDFSLLKDMLHISQDEIGMPVFILSNEEKVPQQEEFFKGDLTQLSAELDKIVPQKAA
jgi:DNA-binding response OmpR family regulator